MTRLSTLHASTNNLRLKTVSMDAAAVMLVEVKITAKLRAAIAELLALGPM